MHNTKQTYMHKHICINKEINMHKLTKFFSPFCINKTYMHKKENKHAYNKLSKFFSPFLSIHQQSGENKSNNKNIYAIYIHEEERHEVSSPAYMHYMKKGCQNPNSHKA